MAQKFDSLQFNLKVMTVLAIAIGIIVVITALFVVYYPETFGLKGEGAKYFMQTYGKVLILFSIATALIAFFLVLVAKEVILLVIQIESDLNASVHALAQIRTVSQATHTVLQKIETFQTLKKKKVDTKELFAIAEKSLKPQEMSESEDAGKRLLVKIKNDIADKKWQEALDSACLFLGRYPDTEEAQGLIGLVSKLKLKLGKCPQCDASIEEGQTRCIRCGYEIDKQKIDMI